VSVQLDHIRPDDLEFLRHLRNAERRWFFDATEISPEAQAGWFASMAADDRTKWYLVRVDGQPAGCFSVRLTDPTSAEVRGILLAEQFRGRGVMTRAIGEAMERLGPHLRYFAEVLPHNEESLQLFERLGFERKFVVMERAAR
jgi:RimJ/RimL family protein N-acetyltransferase